MPRYGLFDRLADGTPLHILFSCARSQLPEVCGVCGFIADYLCDYPVCKNKTCDKPLCRECRRNVGIELDYCPAHFEQWKAYKANNVPSVQQLQPKIIVCATRKIVLPRRKTQTNKEEKSP